MSGVSTDTSVRYEVRDGTVCLYEECPGATQAVALRDRLNGATVTPGPFIAVTVTDDHGGPRLMGARSCSCSCSAWRSPPGTPWRPTSPSGVADRCGPARCPGGAPSLAARWRSLPPSPLLNPWPMWLGCAVAFAWVGLWFDARWEVHVDR